VQNYLDGLARLPADAPAEPVVRALLGRAVDRLHTLCASLLYRHYPRLTRGPLNLQSEEMLSAVVERLIKAMRSVRPPTVRHFFALANQHMRWELNDLARRLDEQPFAFVALPDFIAAEPMPLPPSGETSGTGASRGGGESARRVLGAIESLPEEDREVFNLVRLYGMTHTEAADVLGVSPKTVQRRLNRCLVVLTQQLGDLVSQAPADAADEQRPLTQEQI
jgi:RNA polymerase sigma factor (sigma-70 family)